MISHIRPIAHSANAFLTSQILLTLTGEIGEVMLLGGNRGTRLSDHPARFNRCMLLLRRHEQKAEHRAAQKLITDAGIKLLAAILDELGPDLRLAESLTVGTISCHRIDRVRE